MVEVCGSLCLPVRRKGWTQGLVLGFAGSALHCWRRVRRAEGKECCCSVGALQGVVECENSEALEDVTVLLELRLSATQCIAGDLEYGGGGRSPR